MRFLIIVVGLLLISCENKNLIESEVLFKIQNKEVYSKNILELKIINKSNNDYFLCLDTTSMYFNPGVDYKINEFIHPKPIFYLNDEIIDVGYPLSSMIRPMSLDTAHYNCVKRNIEYSQELLEDLRKLKKILLIKSNTNVTLKLPFNNSQIWCNELYTYIREEGSCKIQFKYKMNKAYFDRIVDKKLLLELQQKKYKPYFKEIVSNKVPFILK